MDGEGCGEGELGGDDCGGVRDGGDGDAGSGDGGCGRGGCYEDLHGGVRSADEDQHQH